MPPAEIVSGTLSELEDALADAIEGARRPDPLARVTVLVGHVLLKRYLPRMLAARGSAHINVRFLRPNELAEELSPAANDARARLSPAAERLLVRDVATAAGGYFAGIAGGAGFTEALMRLFRELELGGFDSPPALERALREADAAGNYEKFAELARLYGRYLSTRASARIGATAERYATADVARLEGELFVYGLWAPAELQTRLIERIAAERPLTAFLPRARFESDDPSAAFRARLIESGATERTIDGGRPTSEIGRLAGALFREDGNVIDAANVSLVSAPDTVREVWEAARACLAWAKDGIRFHEMAIAYRNRDPYRGLVDEIFREAGIGVYLHDGRPLAAHPLGIRLLALLDLAADATFSRRAVMEFLTETQLPAETIRKYGRVRPSQWETYTREAGIVAGIDQWRVRLERLAAEKTERSKDERFTWLAEEATRIADLSQFAADFHADLTSHDDEATWDDHLAYIKRLVGLYASGIEPIVEALDDLKTLAAVYPRASFTTFCRAVRDDLESRDASGVLGEPPRLFGRNGVAVVDATSLRHLRFRAVYMLGVAERAWPPPARPDPLLLEHERALLNRVGQGMIPMRTEPDDEPLTFWLNMQSAGEHLSLSYARADAGGSGKHLPSYFLRAVAEALDGRPLTLAELDASSYVRRIEAGRLANEDIAASLSRAEYDRGLVKRAVLDEDSAPIEVLARDSPAFGLAVDARSARWGSALTAYDGVLTGAPAIARAAAAEFARARPVSPSRLEMYATCPYRYFVRYSLGVDAVREPEEIERIDALERGSMVHAILERFLKRVQGDPPRLEARTRHLALLREAMAEEAQEREARGVTGRPLIWSMDQRQIEDDLVGWYEAEVKEASQTSMRPGAFEVGFGGVRSGFGAEESPLSTNEPVVIRAGDQNLLLQGRIDRIDWDDEREHFRVIDYKTGKMRTKADAVFDKGRALQLPAYLHAAAAVLEMDTAQGEAQYFYVSSGGRYRRTTLSGDDLAQYQGQFEQILTTVTTGVDAGFFAPNPGGKGKPNCTYCEAKDICDASIDRIAQRKTNDPRGAAYRGLEDIK